MSKSKDEYNSEPVVACTGCKSLYINVDDNGNEVCMRCGTVNDTITYPNIENYKAKNKDNDIWETI